jgi:hypothetical protein
VGDQRPKPADKPNGSRPRVLKRAVAWMRSYLRLVNLLAEETFRHGLVWYYEMRGHLVLLDRWFLADYHASNKTAQRPFSRRLHGYLLERLYPKPNLVIYLDAPAEVLFSRKGESSLEVLEWRRQKYLQLRNKVKNFSVVDASQPTQGVAQEVTALITAFHKNRVEGMPCETGGR